VDEKRKSCIFTYLFNGSHHIELREMHSVTKSLMPLTGNSNA